MNLKKSIILLFAFIFWLCSVLFASLQYFSIRNEAILMEENKAKYIILAISSFANSSKDFISEENLENIKLSSNLSTIELLPITKTQFEKAQNKYNFERKHSQVCANEFFQLKNKDNTISFFNAKISFEPTNLIEIQNKIYKIFITWQICGLIFGLISGKIIYNLLNKKLTKLENKLKSNSYAIDKKFKNENFEISELSDLEETANLLKKINEERKKTEDLSFDFNNEALQFNFIKSLSNEILKDKSFSNEDFFIKVKFSKPRNNGLFCEILTKQIDIENNKNTPALLVYGKINSKSNAIDNFSAACLASKSAKILLEKYSPSDAIEKLSKLFDFEKLAILELNKNSIKQYVFEENALKTNFLDDNKFHIFSTSSLAQILQVYSKLDIGSNQDKLDYIIKLAPENKSEVFILIDKM